MFNRIGNGGNNFAAHIGQGENDKDNPLDKDSGQGHPPIYSHAKDNGKGEKGVNAHAGG